MLLAFAKLKKEIEETDRQLARHASSLLGRAKAVVVPVALVEAEGELRVCRACENSFRSKWACILGSDVLNQQRSLMKQMRLLGRILLHMLAVLRRTDVMMRVV